MSIRSPHSVSHTRTRRLPLELLLCAWSACTGPRVCRLQGKNTGKEISDNFTSGLLVLHIIVCFSSSPATISLLLVLQQLLHAFCTNVTMTSIDRHSGICLLNLTQNWNNCFPKWIISSIIRFYIAIKKWICSEHSLSDSSKSIIFWQRLSQFCFMTILVLNEVRFNF